MQLEKAEKGCTRRGNGKANGARYFCKEQKHQNCICTAMTGQRAFCPWGLQGPETDKPRTCWWRAEKGENEVSRERSHFICLASS